MKSLSKRPPYELIQLTLFCLVVTGLGWVWHWRGYSVTHHPNGTFGLGLAPFFVTAVLGGLGVSTLLCSLISICRSPVGWILTGLVSSGAALAVAANSQVLLITATTLAEQRDFYAVGVREIQEAARLLIATRPPLDADPDAVRWFGTEVRRESQPSVLQKLSANASYVAVNEHGIVIVTDGIGGWRSGYLILPPGSPHVPSRARRIADGIYYVTSTTGE